MNFQFSHDVTGRTNRLFKMASNVSGVSNDSEESLEFAELDIDSDVSNSEDFEIP